jgi:hypothetical protein
MRNQNLRRTGSDLARRQACRLRSLKIGALVLTIAFASLLGSAVCQGAANHDTATSSLASLPFLGLGGIMFMREAEKGGPAGGGASTETPPEPVGSTMEERLASATGFIKQFFTDLAASKAENVRLQGQFDAATSTATGIQATLDGVKGELATAQGTIQTLTSEREGFKSQLSQAQGNITRLESLCQLKGIDPSSAVPAVTALAASMTTVEEWNTKIAQAKGNDAQMQVLEDFQKAVAAGTVKKADPA